MSHRDTGSVRIADATLQIQNLAIADQLAVDYIASFEAAERADAVANCITLGARMSAYASDRIGTTELAEQLDASVASVSKLLASASKSTSETIDQTIRTTFGKNGSVNALLEARLKALQTELERSMDPRVASSILGRFTTGLKSELQTAISGFGKTLDVDQPGSVGNRIVTQLNANHKELATKVEGLVTQLAVKSAVSTERLRGTRKGVDFEDAAEEVLTTWARTRRDKLSVVKDASGLIPGCKLGDFLIEINPSDAHCSGLRIAIETKNDQTKHREALRNLSEAMENRGASVGVWISTNPAIVPRGTPPVCFLASDQIFVHVEYDDEDGIESTLVDVALDVARATALVRRTQQSATMDVGAMKRRIDAAIAATVRFAQIKSQLTGISTTAEKAQSLVDEIRAEVRKSLTELSDEIDRQVAASSAETATLRIA